jgi:hypothetical protein
MRKLAFLVAVLGALIMFGTSLPAFAHEGEHEGIGEMKREHMGSDMPMHKGDSGKMMEYRHKMMLETQDIILEALKLIEASAMDKPSAAKAQDLQKRMQAVINSHKAMYEEMMKEMPADKKSGAMEKKPEKKGAN